MSRPEGPRVSNGGRQGWAGLSVPDILRRRRHRQAGGISAEAQLGSVGEGVTDRCFPDMSSHLTSFSNPQDSPGISVLPGVGLDHERHLDLSPESGAGTNRPLSLSHTHPCPFSAHTPALECPT